MKPSLSLAPTAAFLLATCPAAFGQQYFIETYAGSLGPATGSTATAAVINAQGLTLGPTGNILYTSTTQLVEIAQSGLIGRVLGFDDLRFDLADGGDRWYQISAVTSDQQGNVYLLDWNYWRALRIDPSGGLTAVSLPIPTNINNQLRIASSANGILYWCGVDSILQQIDFKTGATSIVAGNGNQSPMPAPDGSLATAVAVSVYGVAVDPSGTLYFTDGALVRRLDPNGLLVTVADFTSTLVSPFLGALVAAPDGTLLVGVDATIARINPSSGQVTVLAGGQPLDNNGGPIAFLQDSNGILYTSEQWQINILDGSSGATTAYAGTGSFASSGDPMPATMVSLANEPTQPVDRMAAGPDGTLYIPELSQQRIRVVDPVSKNSWTIPAYTDMDTGRQGQLSPVFQPLYWPISVDQNGNVLYVEACRVQLMNPSTGNTSTIAGSTTCGTAVAGTAALGNQFGIIYAITTDQTNNLYILDDSLWKIDAATGNTTKVIDSSGLVQFDTNAPLGYVFYGNDGHLAVDSNANLYVNHSLYGWIVKVTPDGTPSLFAGDGGFLYDPSWTTSSLYVSDMAVGSDNALYLAQIGLVTRIDLSTTVMTTVAGALVPNVPPYDGDGGPALNARITPTAIAIGGGSIFIADNPLVRQLYIPPQPAQPRAIQ